MKTVGVCEVVETWLATKVNDTSLENVKNEPLTKNLERNKERKRRLYHCTKDVMSETRKWQRMRSVWNIFRPEKEDTMILCQKPLQRLVRSKNCEDNVANSQPYFAFLVKKKECVRTDVNYPTPAVIAIIVEENPKVLGILALLLWHVVIITNLERNIF